MKCLLVILIFLTFYDRFVLYGDDSRFYDSIKIIIIDSFRDSYEIDVVSEQGLNENGECVSYYYTNAKIYELEGLFNYNFKSVEKSKFRFISRDDFSRLMEVASGLDLWRYHKSYPVNYSPIDGTSIRLQFSRKGSDFQINFHSPEGKEWWPDLAKLVDLMVELSGITLSGAKHIPNPISSGIEAGKESNVEP